MHLRGIHTLQGKRRVPPLYGQLIYIFGVCETAIKFHKANVNLLQQIANILNYLSEVNVHAIVDRTLMTLQKRHIHVITQYKNATMRRFPSDALMS